MVEKGLVRPEVEGYIFNHALIHEAVYASLLRSRRQELHLRAAAWFAARDAALTRAPQVAPLHPRAESVSALVS